MRLCDPYQVTYAEISDEVLIELRNHRGTLDSGQAEGQLRELESSLENLFNVDRTSGDFRG